MGHGTHVAGIAAAETDNDIGIAGISWENPLLIAKITHDSPFIPGDSFVGATAAGIRYSVDSKVKIVNISMGMPIGFNLFTIFSKDILCEAVSYAISKKVLVVAAAGNDGTSTKYYPAACPGALAVGGTTGIFDPKKASFSNFGPWVDIAAPAIGIVSTVPRNDTCSDEDLCDPSGYDGTEGTSMSAPMVSGALALLKSRNPSMSNNLLIKRLRKSAIELPDSGLGQLNIFDAVFNGDFELTTENAGEVSSEDPQFEEWQHDGASDYNCIPFASHFDFGILPPKGDNMLACHNGGKYRFNPSIDSVASGIRNVIDIAEGVTELPLSFSWKVLSSDLDGLSIYDDRVIIELVRKNDTNKRTTLFATSLNNIQNEGRTLSLVPSLTGFLQTDWVVDSYTHPIEHGAGEYYLRIYVLDIWDSVGDTMFLVDDIRFRER